MNVNFASSHIKKHGFCYFPNFLSPKYVQRYRVSAQKIIDSHPYSYNCSYDESVHLGQIQGRQLLKAAFSLRYLLKSLYSPYIFSVLSNVFEEPFYKISYHRQIIAQRTYPTPNPPSQVLHWDRLRSLKCWFYLEDCDINSGPINIVPGTHFANRSMRLSALSSLRKDEASTYDLLNNSNAEATYPASSDFSLPTQYSAGDLIIFDTDCSHGARPVNPGYSRFILRSYSTLSADLQNRNVILSRSK